MSNHRCSNLLAPLALAIAGVVSHSSAFAAEFPVGSYVAHKNVTLVFDGKGQFQVQVDKVTKVSGSYRAKGDQLELTDKNGPWACTKDGEQTGAYSWKYEDSVLTLTKVADRCDARSGTLTPATWQHH
jgi:hypothetical protein